MEFISILICTLSLCIYLVPITHCQYNNTLSAALYALRVRVLIYKIVSHVWYVMYIVFLSGRPTLPYDALNGEWHRPIHHSPETRTYKSREIWNKLEAIITDFHHLLQTMGKQIYIFSGRISMLSSASFTGWFTKFSLWARTLFPYTVSYLGKITYLWLCSNIIFCSMNKII